MLTEQIDNKGRLTVSFAKLEEIEQNLETYRSGSKMKICYAILLIQFYITSSIANGNEPNDIIDNNDQRSEEFGDFSASDKTSNLKVGQKLNQTSSSTSRYLIYGVNPGEGFNLRRDVFIRAANLVKHLRNIGEDFILVLPPWRHMYHWRSSMEQNAVPWKKFFSINNLNKYIPVLEFDEFVKRTGSASIDSIVYLQRHPDGFKNG